MSNDVFKLKPSKILHSLMVAGLTLSLAAVPATIYAQDGGGDSGGGANSGDGGGISSGVSGAATNSIGADIGSEASKCKILPLEYRADCLSQSLKISGRKIRKKAYDPVKTEVFSSANEIDAIVTENLDEEAPVIKYGSKTYRPVKKEALDAVNMRVSAVISESATRLIRSAGNSVTRKIHFQRIAKALDSTKVLLRSA